MDEMKKTCWECGCIIEDDNYTTVDGKLVCNDCYDEYYVVCDHCGDIEHVDNSHYINDRIVCDYCRDSLYVQCDDCGEYVERRIALSTRTGFICESCYENDYLCCYDCGVVIHVDDSHYHEGQQEYYCEDCYPDDSVIHDYYYKPEPVFYGKNDKLYLGVELEIDGAGEDNDNAQRILNIAGDDRIYCKHDGSLNEGFEIVSHPCTLEFHTDYMEWFDVMQEALEMGYKSHDAGTCGLHVHVSKSALGDSYSKQEETISNILYFIEKYWYKFLKFSRRTEEQLARWANRYGLTEGETPADMMKKAKANYNRYRAINLQNSNTLEFRFFRGTLKHTTFIATLQLVKHLCDMCTYFNEDDIQQISWNDFIDSIENADADYSDLLQYLRDRKISREEF